MWIIYLKSDLQTCSYRRVKSFLQARKANQSHCGWKVERTFVKVWDFKQSEVVVRHRLTGTGYKEGQLTLCNIGCIYAKFWWVFCAHQYQYLDFKHCIQPYQFGWTGFSSGREKPFLFTTLVCDTCWVPVWTQPQAGDARAEWHDGRIHNSILILGWRRSSFCLVLPLTSVGIERC